MSGVFSNITDLQAAAWDAICAGHPNVSHGWLRTVAEYSRSPPDLRIFVIREGGRLLGAAACHVVSEDGSRSINDRLLGRAAWMRHVPGLDLRPALICGVGAAHGATGLLVLSTLAAHERERITRNLIEMLETYAQEQRLTLIFNNMLETEASLGILMGRDYAQTLVMPSVVLPIGWSDVGGYLAYLKSRSRNAFENAKKEINRCRASGTEVVQSPITDEHASVVYDLLSAHHRLKNSEPFPYKAGFLSATRQYCGDGAALFLALKDRRVVAAAFTLQQAHTMWSAFVGMDRPRCTDNSAYFNITFHAPARDAIRLHVRKIVLGPGAYDAKLKRGGHLVRRHVLVRRWRSASHRFTRSWLRWYERWHMAKHAELYARNRGYISRESARSFRLE
ncbi:MAG TPA: GNAT family N-acetyltransferase [Gammaproteobacteria bacterium]|nr:GNAT family N-acetyltransferase [Gammaproteobacteria bacterium]